MATVYKICPRGDWAAAEVEGRYDGSADDRRDGYIHLSTRHQLKGTAAKHFAGADGLVLLAIDDQVLGSALLWEPSRGGALFPHYYGSLAPHAVHASWPLPLGPGGTHLFPEELPE